MASTQLSCIHLAASDSLACKTIYINVPTLVEHLQNVHGDQFAILANAKSHNVPPVSCPLTISPICTVQMSAGQMQLHNHQHLANHARSSTLQSQRRRRLNRSSVAQHPDGGDRQATAATRTTGAGRQHAPIHTVAEAIIRPVVYKHLHPQ